MSDISQKDAYGMMLSDYPDVLSVEQMCSILRISTKTGYKLLNNSKITCIKVGKAYRVPKIHILSYLLIGTHKAS